MARNFRFGVGVRSVRSRAELQETAWRLEDFGFDVLNVPDHLGALAPFPTLSAVAQSTTRIRVGSYVMNAAFYSPALLGRDAAELHTLSDGRFDLGLGAGYVREEFEAAEIPFPSAGKRVDHLAHVCEYLRAQHPKIPILIAGNGDRVLTVAAQYADIVALTGSTAGSTATDPLAERIALVRRAAGDRVDDLVLDLAITGMPTDSSGVPDLSLTRRFAAGLSDQQVLALPSVLSGSPADMADQIRGLRERYGITSFSIQVDHAPHFAKVIAALR